MIKQLLINELKYHKILLIVEAVLLLIGTFPFLFIDLAAKTMSIKVIFIGIFTTSIAIFSSKFHKEKIVERLVIMPLTPFVDWSVKISFQMLNWAVIFLTMLLLLTIKSYIFGSLFELNSLLIINFLIFVEISIGISPFDYSSISFASHRNAVIHVITLIINIGMSILYFALVFGNDPAKLLGNLLGLNPAGYNMLLLSVLLNITGIFSLYLSYRIFLSRRSFIEPKSAY